MWFINKIDTENYYYYYYYHHHYYYYYYYYHHYYYYKLSITLINYLFIYLYLLWFQLLQQLQQLKVTDKALNNRNIP